MSALFFAGKIFGRDPDIDLAAAMRAETPKLDRDAIKAVLVDCGAELKGRGEQIRAAGAELKNDSQRLGPL